MAAGVRLAPRYDGPVVLAIDDHPSSQLLPVTRQRRRFQEMLAELTDDQWGQASRCEGWTACHVVAHLVSVNEFWNASVIAGLAGEPTRVMAGFDPATTPPLFVDAMSSLSPSEVLDQFVSTNESLLATLSALTIDEWSMPAESPAGHVPIRLLAQHALWDSWIHERDVALPLGITPGVEPDEVTSCLRYAAVVSPVLAIGLGRAVARVLAAEATDPTVRFVLDVGDYVSLRNESFDRDLPCLRGDAVEMTEALSLRIPMSPSTPIEWSQLLGGLEAAFDAE
jgi:uncharacterized protein (TIGR03083 family)